MANYYQYKPGLGAVGEYQAAGKPFALQVDAGAGPTQVSFPTVTRWVAIINHQNADLDVGFSANGLPSNGGVNYFRIDADSGTDANSDYSVRLELKLTELWLEGSNEVSVIAGLTSIPTKEIINNWSGSIGVG